MNNEHISTVLGSAQVICKPFFFYSQSFNVAPRFASGHLYQVSLWVGCCPYCSPPYCLLLPTVPATVYFVRDDLGDGYVEWTEAFEDPAPEIEFWHEPEILILNSSRQGPYRLLRVDRVIFYGEYPFDVWQGVVERCDRNCSIQCS